MTPPRTSTGARLVVPAARPERCGRRAQATAAGLLTAAALGAGVLLLPATSSDAADVVTVAAVQRPVQLVQLAAPIAVAAPNSPPAQPVRPLRDPFRPLVSDSGADAPAGGPDTSAGAPGGGTPPFDETTLDFGAPPDFGSTPGFDDGRSPGGLDPAPGSPPGTSGEPSGTSPNGPTSGTTSLVGRRLSLTRVQVSGATFTAVLSLDGTSLRATPGTRFGPGGELLLVSVQQGPAASQWTAVVKRGRGTPFDVVTGTPTRIR